MQYFFPKRRLVLSFQPPLAVSTALAMAEPGMALVAGGAGAADNQLMVEMGLQDSSWKSVRHWTSNPLESYRIGLE